MPPLGAFILAEMLYPSLVAFYWVLIRCIDPVGIHCGCAKQRDVFSTLARRQGERDRTFERYRPFILRFL